MLMQEDDETLELLSKKFLDVQDDIWIYEGPFVFGEEISLGDIMMAPWFDRMCVLEHYKNFVVPDTVEFERWTEWSYNVLHHPAVKPTREPEEKLIEYYRKYFDHTARDKYYDKYYKNWSIEDLKGEMPVHPVYHVYKK